MNKSPLSNTATVASLAILLVGIFLGGWFAPGGLNWIIVAVLIALFVGVLGLRIMARFDGVLINSLNVMSLSRFQMVLWTIIVLSSYFTMVLARSKSSVDDPLGVEIDKSLWILLGISTTSLVGTPLLQAKKKNKTPDSSEVEDAAESLTPKTSDANNDQKEVEKTQKEVEDNRKGLLFKNSSPMDAELTDIFQGDEVGNTAQIDVAKLQMFIFTIIAALSYCVTVFNALRAAGNDGTLLQNLPAVPDGLVAVLGISHAGYLASKTTDHTQVEKK